MNGYESLEDALEVLERASDMDGPDVSEEEEAYFDEAGWADADEPTSPAADRPESDQRSAFAALHGALGTATIFSEQAAKLAGHQALVRNVDHIFEHIDRARRDGLLSPEEAGELTRAAIRGLVRKPGPGEKPSANEPAVPELLDWGLQKAEISLAGESDQPPQSLAHWDTVNLPMPASAAPSVPIMAAIPSEALEVRPPGRGEASAFDRRQELIDRMNMQSAAISYRLDGCTIVYQVLDDTRFNNFDRQMMRLIDLADVIPLRLIDRTGYVGGIPLAFDSMQEGYVDLDDLLASTDLAFQLLLIHFLTERSQIRDYARRIGTDLSGLYPAAHRAGRQAEAEHLRSVTGDTSIEYVYDEPRPSGAYVIGFRSKAERYWIFRVNSNRAQPGLRGSSLFVQTPDRRRITVEQLQTERATHPAPTSPAAPAPAPP